MRKITLLFTVCIALLFSESIFSQDTDSDYEIDMMNLANKAVAKIKKENKLVVAVWFFHNTKGKKTDLGDYVGRDFSVHFTNVAKNFEVVDRDHIEQLSSEHQWNEEGFIDPATAKEVNKLIAADAIVTGTVDYTLHHLRVRIKIIDTQTGKQIAAAIKTVRPDESLKYILNEEYENRKSRVSKKDRTIIVEGENDPRSTNEDCERLKTGDYCFQNNTKSVYTVFLNDPNNVMSNTQKVTINPGQNGCLFGLRARVYSFRTFLKQQTALYEKTNGTVKVEKCKSLTYTIINDGSPINTDTRKPKPQSKTKQKPAEQILDIFVNIIKNRKNKFKK